MLGGQLELSEQVTWRSRLGQSILVSHGWLGGPKGLESNPAR